MFVKVFVKISSQKLLAKTISSWRIKKGNPILNNCLVFSKQIANTPFR